MNESDSDTDLPTDETASTPRPQAPRAPRVKPKRGSGNATKILVGITLLGFAVFATSVGAVAYIATTEDAGDVKEGSFLSVRLSGVLPDAPSQGGLLLDPALAPPLVTEIAAAIDHAATDDRITGLYLDIDGVGAGWGSMQEIRDSLVTFRAAGKPCVAYSEMYSNGSYYLASACDRVVLAPAGAFMVIGIQAEITYYADMFEKIGVEADMLHVGDFKSAVEPYERTGPSEPASEAFNFLLDGLYDNFIASVASGRGLTDADVRALINTPPLAPNTALERGAVDLLAYRDAVKASLTGPIDESWNETVKAVDTELDKEELEERFTSLSEYLKGLRYQNNASDDYVAVIHADGPIVSGDGDGGMFGETSLADRPFRSWFRKARADDSVKAVVLRVNSPGGSGLASDMMLREVQLTQAAGKPVVVSMGDYAASGGYYISCDADWIVAQPTTLTGSIGVFGGKVTFGGTYEKLGLNTHAYQRGENADMFSVSAPFSDTNRVVMQGFLDNFYDQFLSKVAAGREMEVSAVHEVAQGRVWTGTQALDRKLVDELGGLDVAIAKAAELAGVEDPGIKRLPMQKTLVEVLLEDFGVEAVTPAIDLDIPGMTEKQAQALRDVLVLEEILSEDGVAAMLPARIAVE